jgi:hypothetical protein
MIRAPAVRYLPVYLRSYLSATWITAGVPLRGWGGGGGRGRGGGAGGGSLNRSPVEPFSILIKGLLGALDRSAGRFNRRVPRASDL